MDYETLKSFLLPNDPNRVSIRSDEWAAIVSYFHKPNAYAPVLQVEYYANGLLFIRISDDRVVQKLPDNVAEVLHNLIIIVYSTMGLPNDFKVTYTYDYRDTVNYGELLDLPVSEKNYRGLTYEFNLYDLDRGIAIRDAVNAYGGDSSVVSKILGYL